MSATNDLALNRRNVLLGSTTLGVAAAFAQATPLAHAQTSSSPPQPLPPSPGWTRALPTGPDTRVKITEEYARHDRARRIFLGVAAGQHLQRRQAFKDVKEIVMAGPVPAAPLNRFAMLTDYITPDQRIVACPNQDVVYGAGSLALDLSPVVIQVPDFGDRFWVYQMVDLRTDSSCSSARCTARRRASTCWSGRTGKVKCRRASPKYSGPRPTPALSRPAFSRTTRRRTSRQSKACCNRSDVPAGGIRRRDEEH